MVRSPIAPSRVPTAALVCAFVCALALAPTAHAQVSDSGTTGITPTGDSGVAAPDPALAATVGRGDGGATDAAAAADEPVGNCQADPVPAGHAVRVEVHVGPEAPVVGDRVILTFRLNHQSGDRVEYDPDPAAFAQPAIELEYAREQPERSRASHGGASGMVYGEVSVAVQPFRTGNVVIAPQLARLIAGGDIVRVCTPVVRFRVRDPFGNTSHPYARDLTPPESVTEDAYRWRTAALVLDAIFVIVLTTLIVSTYLRRRPRAVVPPPPPRPAWETALASLDTLGRSDLLSRGHTKDYYDAISDITRRYIGGMRGFDALEMTTDELMGRLKQTPLPGVTTPELAHLLGECDLVKFARYVPTHDQAENILAQAYGVVRRSMLTTGPRTGGPGGGSAGGAKPASPPTDARRA